jgi:8-oxo-dGTP diphosphatase
MNSKSIICADVIAKYGNMFVVLKRLNFPAGLALAGGKQEGRELLSETAMREFQEETGLSLVIEDVLGTFADDNRDPRGHYISTVFVGTAYGMPVDEPGKTHVVFLTKEEIYTCSNLFVLDHFQILEKYFEKE